MITERAGENMFSACGWKADLSRHRLDAAADDALIAFGNASHLGSAIERLFSGPTSPHWAMRTALDMDLPESAAKARACLAPAMHYAETVRATGIIRTVIHIGIGGSDAGPRFLADAFADRIAPGNDIRFAANIDPLDLDRALRGLDPEHTLVICVSKSFTTDETIANLARARCWLENALGAGWREHIALVTSAQKTARSWLDGPGQVFTIPEAIGGRWSVWSAVSLGCMIVFGSGLFREFLAGAAAMDSYVRTAPLARNLACRLALLDYWNASVLGLPVRVMHLYANRLRLLLSYLQQLEMESNGKSVGVDGRAVPTETTPALWGGEGTLGQHSYQQWMHQGSHAPPSEFIIAAEDDLDTAERRRLISHALAQAELMWAGRSLEQVRIREPELDLADAAQRIYAGGRSSTVLFTPSLTPGKIGELLALYEHRTYLAGVLWGINSFDQWGVEGGKLAARDIESALAGRCRAADPVSAALVAMIRGV